MCCLATRILSSLLALLRTTFSFSSHIHEGGHSIQPMPTNECNSQAKIGRLVTKHIQKRHVGVNLNNAVSPLVTGKPREEFRVLVGGATTHKCLASWKSAFPQR